MYETYYGFENKPFSITPDPRFLYMSARHREALAHLLYGIGEGGGFVQLTGEVGTGKTTLCRCLLEQLPDGVDVALILNPMLNAFELVATICDELKISYPADASSIKTLIDVLNEHLLRTHAAGHRTVLIIDEAQNLSAEVLEQIRLLTNLETTQYKLLQIILIGQPELKALLERSDMRQLAQRVTARYHLEPLRSDEVRAYIEHRLRVSGWKGNLFSTPAMNDVLRLSGGIPRMINILCDRALLGAYVEERKRVDRRIVRKAAGEVLPAQDQAAPLHWVWRAAAVMVIAAPLGWWSWVNRDRLWGAETVNAEIAEVTDAEAASEPHGAMEVGKDESQAMLTATVTVPQETLAKTEVDPGAESVVNDEEAPEPDLDILLANAGSSNDLQAWVALFELWGASLWLDGELQPCEQAKREGLRCLVRKGNWTQLRAFNRPALLELVDDSGRHVSVVLRQLNDEQAELVVAGQQITVGRDQVDTHWYGTFVLLWKPPVETGVLRLGDRGPGVRWLRSQLDDQIGGTNPAKDPSLFDTELERRVKLFQARHALRQDGVVGSETLIHLNSHAASGDSPVLQPVSS
jgi:general secretion pathway protein A